MINKFMSLKPKGNKFDSPTLIKKPYQKFIPTPEQSKEFTKCAIDPIYFIENYIWIQGEGKSLLKLHDYQKEMVMCYWKYKNVCAMASRQLGKTTTAVAFLLWYATFHDNVNILIAANIFRAATEIMDRVKFSYEELPDFLRNGILVYNVQKIVFDNGSKIESTTTTPTAGRGKSIHLLYLDEFAFVEKRIASDFYSAIGPTLSATNGKWIITSTPNSDEDQFAQIWHGANDILDEYGNERPSGIGKNGFKAFKAIWSQHPNRDEKWAEAERAKFGYEKFSREYDLKFITADMTLIDSVALTTLKGSEPLFKTGDIRWWEKPQVGSIYLVALDPSMGVGKDYAAIQVWKLPEMVQVAEWMHNKSDSSIQLKTVIQICTYIDREIKAQAGQYADPEIFWTFESNTVGEGILTLLREYGVEIVPAQLMNEPTNSISLSTVVKRGLNTNGRSKSQSTIKLKSLIESHRMKIKSSALISELKTYVSNNNSFSAKSGDHDDLVSALLLIVRMSQMIAKWDDNAAETIRDSNIIDIDDLIEPMPMSISIW